MTRDERKQIRERINSRPITDFMTLDRAPKGNKSWDGQRYVCPICGSGSKGKKDTGFMIYKEVGGRFRHICRANGCFDESDKKGQDTLGALRVLWSCTEDEVFEQTGAANLKPVKMRDPVSQQKKEERDYTEYYQQMSTNLDGAIDYISGKRHISIETAHYFGCGYDMRWKHPDVVEQQRAKGSDWTPPASRRWIIPTSPTSYIARNIDPDDNYPKQKVGSVHLFNVDVLHNPERRPVYIVEGEIDAMSFYEVGALACALGSTSNTGMLQTYLKENPTECFLLIAMDNDESGQKAAHDLDDKLSKIGLKRGTDYEIVSVYGTNNDANDFLCADREGFRNAVHTEEAKHRPGAHLVQSFFQAVQTRRYEPIPTGLEPLDDAIDGGFIRQTLVTMGAAPGMGKTYFAQQLFEGMAALGHNVIYYNLEMSKTQMLARSFARIAHEQDGSTMRALDVLQGYRWTDAQRVMMNHTAEIYSTKIAPHMAYNPGEATAQLDVILNQIERAAEQAEKRHKEAPIVVIDYLHLLRGDQREDAQTMIKRAVERFKDYAVRYNTVSFIILAFNRDSNKSGKVTLESARDSSAIEYGADLSLGLNYSKVEDESDSELIEKARAAANADADKYGCVDYKLKVVKNRFGRRAAIDLVFYGGYGLFVPKTTKDGMTIDTQYDPSVWVTVDRRGRKNKS